MTNREKYEGKTVNILEDKKMKNGDIVRWYLNPQEYITGVVVGECGDSTVWVEHNNGQQRHYKETELVLDNPQN